MKLEQLLSFVIAIVTVDTREEMGPDKIQNRYRHSDNGIVTSHLLIRTKIRTSCSVVVKYSQSRQFL